MNKILLAAALLLIGGVIPMHADQTNTETKDRVQTATAALHTLTSGFDRGIPNEVYKGAKCIAVVPRMLKGGFIVTGKHGRGVASCRLPDGSWSTPAFFTISGGSWGIQAGIESVDLVMMVMNDEGARHLLHDKFQIGGSASGAVGPWGRYAAAGVDWKLGAQILTYSRSRGLFGGVDLSGAWVRPDRDSTTAFYGKDVTVNALLTGQVPAPPEAKQFTAEVAHANTQARDSQTTNNEAEAR